jgi:hypothetical protein
MGTDRRVRTLGLRSMAALIVGLFIELGRLGIAHAEPEVQKPVAERWRTSFAISMKALQQRAEGHLSSTLATDEVSNTPIPLNANNHDDYFVPVIPIELGIETPSFSLPATEREPRLFLQAGYQFIPITERDFLQDGKFVTLPANPTPGSEGLGGEIRVDLQHQWSVSAGISIPFEISGIPFEVRPSLDYMGQWVRASSRVIGIDVGTNAVVDLISDESKALHYLGPRLGIETDAGRAGSGRIAFFMEGSVYFSRVAGHQRLSGRSVSGTQSSQFEYEPDQLLFQVGVGVRLYWEH